MSRGRAALAVLLLAAAVRVLLLLALEDPQRPLEGDERGYGAVARSLSRGEGFRFTVEGTSLRGEEVTRVLHAYRAPLLPAVLAPVAGLSGGTPLALRLANALLGALVAPLALLVAWRLSGARAGWAAGLLLALWPTQVWLSGRVLSEPLDALLLLAGVDLLLRRRFRLAGLALGMAVLCRPGGLPAVVLLAAAAAFVALPGARRGAVVSVAATAALVILPWVVRNAVVLGHPVLTTTSGVTIYGGTCAAVLEGDNPGGWIPPEEAWTGEDPPDLGMYGWSGLDEAASSARFSEAALRWAASHPAAALALASRKVIRLLHPDPRSRKEDAGLKALVGYLSWLPLLVAALAAWIHGLLRRPAAPWWVVTALVAGHVATAMLTYGDARMRAPFVPALLAVLVIPYLAGGMGWTHRAAEDRVSP